MWCVYIVSRMFQIELGNFYYNIMTLPSLYVYLCLMEAKDNSGYTLVGDHHNYDTRNTNRVHIDFLRLKSSRYSSNYYCKIFYNRLPMDWVSLPRNLYKQKLKAFLIRESFYSVKDFMEYKFDVTAGL